MLSDASNRWVHLCKVVNYKQEREISTAGQTGKTLPALPEQLTHYRPDPGRLCGIYKFFYPTTAAVFFGNVGEWYWITWRLMYDDSAFAVTGARRSNLTNCCVVNWIPDLSELTLPFLRLPLPADWSS
jgi:hypothetical protein